MGVRLRFGESLVEFLPDLCMTILLTPNVFWQVGPETVPSTSFTKVPVATP